MGASVKGKDCDLRKYGLTPNNGVLGLVVSIVPEHRSAAGKAVNKWSLVKLSGFNIDGKSYDGYHLVYDWWRAADGQIGAFYIIYEPHTLKMNVPLKNATIEITDWVANKSKKTGGAKWNKNEADKFLKQIYGKKETINRVHKLYMDVASKINSAGGDISSIIKEPQHLSDWQNILANSGGHYNMAEAAFNELKSINESGVRLAIILNDQSRGQIQDLFEKLHYEEEAHLDDEKKLKDWQKRSGVEKAWQGAKTVGLAPERGAIELMLRKNFVGMASALKIAKERKPSAYEAQRTKWLQLGGNRTKFDAAVESGAKKKPFLAKDTRKTYSVSGVEDMEDEGSDSADKGDALEKIGSVSSEMAKVQFPPKGSGYVQLPVGIGAAAAAAITASSSGSAAAYAVPAGVVLDGICIGINAAKIPKKGSEENVSAPDYSDIKGDLKKDDTQKILKNVAIYGGIAVGATALIYVTYRLLKPKK